jgi:hypothetical protein
MKAKNLKVLKLELVGFTLVLLERVSNHPLGYLEFV